MNEFRRLTYSENGAWGLRGASLMSCPPEIYGACAKLCDLEGFCGQVAAARDRRDAIYALQRLLDIGLGGRFVELEKVLEVKA